MTPAKAVLKGLIKISVILATLYAMARWVGPRLSPADYRAFPLLGSRVAIWIMAELHLLFAAFVLGVPLFAVTTEIIGIRTRDPRYDRLAHEFIRLIALAFTITAILGALFFLGLFFLYPKFFGYMTRVFKPTYYLYAALILGEVVYTYLYYYSWDVLQNSKGLHVTIGILLNVFGTLIMFTADAWATFMMSPAGVNPGGALTSFWAAIHNITWMPLNVHRLIANVAFGGFIVGAYAAFKFLSAQTDAERAHYDWMGYVGNFIGICGMIPLPFAGYWLAKEVYAFNETMGISMMGGIFSWLFIIQAVLIGMLFIGGNYYLWLAMERIPGAERFRGYIKWLLTILIVCFAVWLTPHTLVVTLKEQQAMGGAHHPLVGVFGVMSAKNTAVNLIILTTFFSFMMYWRSNLVLPATGRARTLKILEYLIYGLAAAAVVSIGVYGYFVPTIVRVEKLSPAQVGTVLAAMILIVTMASMSIKGATSLGEIRWGAIPRRSQYALILLSVTIVLLMGLMGYLRSALRQNYHVYGLLKDTHPGAFTPTLGYATQVIATVALLFYGFVCFVFWLGQKTETKNP